MDVMDETTARLFLAEHRDGSDLSDEDQKITIALLGLLPLLDVAEQRKIQERMIKQADEGAAALQRALDAVEVLGGKSALDEMFQQVNARLTFWRLVRAQVVAKIGDPDVS